MTDKIREAAQQALTTIEAAIITLEAANEQGKITDIIWINRFETIFDFLGFEADALRAALAEPDPRNQCGETCERAKLCAVCFAEMGKQGSKPEQKPVAWMYTSHWNGDERFITRYQSELTAYKADKVWPLYTAPQQREWQKLTDEEISAISKSDCLPEK